MDRRTHEGLMDWEYQNQPPVDHSSPFAKFSSQRAPISSFNASPSRPARDLPNPFLGSPLKNNQPHPPHTSSFQPSLARQPTAPAFRNPAFSTPQRHAFVDSNFSEMSGIESSPAMTDASPVPAETPDVDRDADPGTMTIKPSTSKTLFGKGMFQRSRTPGKGEIARGNRDKVRKRKRQQGDRDVGSVRSRLPHDSDDSDSDWEGHDPRASAVAKRSWLANFLAAVSDHPNAPAILSKWLQLGVNIAIVSIGLFGVFTILSQMRTDLTRSSDKARAEIAKKIAECTDNFIRNGCLPKASRPPALDAVCNDWDVCMNQDADAIIGIQVSARTFAEIMNEFVGVITFKTWGFLISLFLAIIVASNVGFGFLRDSAMSHPTTRPVDPLHSPAAVPPMLSSSEASQQAYIWAPITHTPRHIRRNLFANDASDTDNSPEIKSIMPPQTPSGRRSPSKGGRGRSPVKSSRSPSKGY